MANDVTSTIWRIDTLPFSWPYRIYIASMEWTDQTAAGDAIVFTQADGKALIDSKAYAADFMQNFGKKGWVEGITGVTLTSGVLYINVGGSR